MIGILLVFRQVIRLFPGIAWVNSFRLADPGLAVERPPVLLAPMAAILGDRAGRMSISSQTMQGLLDSLGTRLDEARDMSRYMTCLGLLGTFWGLIRTVEAIQQPARIVDQSLWQSETENLGLAHEPVVARRIG